MKYEVFICYKQNTAKDYALHLWEGLREFQHTAFLNIKDIPTIFSEGTDKWRECRDNAIINCEAFLMIVTRGFENSLEIQKEMDLAIEQKKKFMCFRDRNLPESISIKSARAIVNLGEYQQIPFDTPEGLLRAVLYNLEPKEGIAPASSIQQPPQTEEKRRFPLVHFYITQAVQNNLMIKRELPNVGFNIRNLGDSPIRAKIKARVFLGGRDLGLVKGEIRGGKYMGYYDGRILWNLNPYTLFFGNFSVPEMSARTDENLRIKVSVTLIDAIGQKHKLLPVSWTFMRDNNDWFLEPIGDC